MESVRIIITAVNENNTTLALRTVNSELEKNPTSDVYLALKVLVAKEANDRSLAIATAEQAVKHCSKKTMQMFLIPVLSAYNESDILSTAFVRTNRLDPQDQAITEAWTEVMLLLGNLSAAQKALMAQLKHSKKPRRTCFEVCLVMALDKPNPLFPMLAERMLDKHLPVQSSQECYVAALVRKMTSQDKMVEYLQAPANSGFVAASLDLQQLLLTALQNLKKWTELLEYAKNQLERIDSFNYWEALNSAATALGTVDDAVQFNAKFKGNNASLARVDLAAKSGIRPIAKAVAEYWQTMSSKPSAYDYIKPYASIEIVDSLPVKKDLGSMVNMAKLKALVSHPAALTSQQLFDLYERHKSEIPKEATDYFVGTDALLLAAAQILRNDTLASFNREKAAAILEYGVKNDPHHFYARLLLIQIYRSLGAFDLALKHFDTLSIRNLQFETLGHLLATRAGSVDPELAARVIERKLLVARKRVPDMGVFATASLTDGAFTQFQGIFDLGKRLRYSMGYALLLLEKIKSNRVNRGFVDMSDVMQIPEPASALLDSRDFTTSFDAKASEVCSVGPKQGAEYVRIQKCKETAYLKAMTSGKPDGTDLSFATEVARSNEHTPVERWNAQTIADALAGKKPEDPPQVSDQFADWAVLHWCYTVLETVKILKNLKASAPYGWTHAVRATCSQYTSRLDEYENAATEAVKSAVPFESAGVISKIKESLRHALRAISDAK